MKTDVRSNHRCCASCEYWGGERQLKQNSNGQIFIVDNFLDVRTTAICNCGTSRYCSQNMSANHVVCERYLKWRALR